MQDVSPGYLDQVTTPGAERAPVAEVTADWTRSGTPQPVRVAGVQVRRTLSLGLPEEATLIAGTAVAVATLDLVGDSAVDGETALARLSPYRADSDLADVDTEGIPVVVRLGFEVDGVPETVPQLIGTMSDVDLAADATGSTVSVEVLDGSEALRVPARLPVAVGPDPLLDRPGTGLNTQCPVDLLARQGGFFASPPARPECIVSAPLHGSLTAEIGDLIGGGAFSRFLDESTVVDDPSAYAQGKWALAPALADHVTLNANYTTARPVQLFDTDEDVTFSGWVWIPAAPDPAPNIAIDTNWALSTQDGLWQILAQVDTSAPGVTTLSASMTLGGVLVTFTDVARALTPGWHYIGAHFVAFTSGPADDTVQVEWRVDAESIAADSRLGLDVSAGSEPMTIALLQTGQPVEAWQVDTLFAQVGEIAWDDAFVPNAVLEPGAHELLAIPAVPPGALCWDMLQQIAAAEAGLTFVDEARVFRSWNRRHFETAGASTTVQAELTAPAITGLSMSRLAYRVRNVIRVAASPVIITGRQRIWEPAEVLTVPARGELSLLLPLGDAQAYQVETQTDIIPPGGTDGGFVHSGYRAARNPDGSGGEVRNLVMVVESFAGQVKVTWTNPNGFPAHLVSPTGAGYPSESDGRPAALVQGRLITTTTTTLDGTESVDNTGVVVEWREDESVTLFGELVLPIEANPWRQRTEDAASLARHIGLRTAWPIPQFGEVRVRGRPELQIGDLVELTDGSGRTGLDHEPCIVMGHSPDYTGGKNAKLSSPMMLMPVARPFQLILDAGERSELDSDNIL